MNSDQISTGTHVVVVGGGAVGLSIAYELLQRGVSVKVLEANDQIGQGASDGNAGLVSGTMGHPLTGWSNIRTGLSNLFNRMGPFRLHISPRTAAWMIPYLIASRAKNVAKATTVLRRLCRRGLFRHIEIAELGLDTGFSRRGVMITARSEQALMSLYDTLGEHPDSVDATLLDPAEMRDVGVAVQHQAGGLLCGDDAHTDGARYARAMAKAVEDLGGELSTGISVTDLLRSSRGIHGVELTDGTILRADHVVLAAGVATRALANSVGLRLPITGGKGYSIDMESGPGDPAMPIMLKDDAIAITPYADRVRVAGVLEIGAEEPGDDDSRIQGILDSATAALPALTGRRIMRTWYGFRCCTADGLPIIGDTGPFHGLSIATGHGQQGLVLAPVSADIIAMQICGGHTGLPSDTIRAVSPERFKRPGYWKHHSR